MEKFWSCVLLFTGAYSFSYAQPGYTIKRYSVHDGLPPSISTSLAEDALGYLWIGAWSNGVTKFDGHTFVNYTVSDGLLSNTVTDVRVDNQNHIWLQHPHGFSKFDGTRFHKFALKDIKQPVQACCIQGDTLIFAVSPGIIGFVAGNEIGFLNTYPEFLSHPVVSIYGGADGRLYFQLKDHRIVSFNGKKFITIKMPVDEGAIDFVNHGDTTYLSTANKLYRTDFSEKRLVRLPYIFPYHVKYAGQPGDYWSLTGKVLRRHTLSHPGKYTSEIILEEMPVLDLLADAEGLTWMVTYNGLYRYSPSVLQKAKDESINSILSITTDKDSNIWFGSWEGGLWKESDQDTVSDQNDENLHTHRVTHLIAEEDAMWVASHNHWRTINTHFRHLPFHLMGVEVLYRGRANPYSSEPMKYFNIPRSLEFPWHSNQVTFRFNRVNKRYPHSVKYRFKLENFDTEWSPISAYNAVTYTNLPPGRYKLRVKTSNFAGKWILEDFAYDFSIRQPFYKTFTFILISGLLLILIAILSVSYYSKIQVRKVLQLENIRRHEQELLRSDIARDFHDEIGNYLVRIISLTGVLKLGGNSALPKEELYDRIESLSKSLHGSTRDFIWSIDPSNDDVDKLFIYLKDFGERLFADTDVKFRAFFDAEENMKLPFGHSRDIVMIFKEAFTNALKHSRGTEIDFLISLSLHETHITLRDNGIGLSHESSIGHGLKNMRYRAARLGAQLAIGPRESGGVSITLVFKNSNPQISKPNEKIP